MSHHRIGGNIQDLVTCALCYLVFLIYLPPSQPMILLSASQISARRSLGLWSYQWRFQLLNTASDGVTVLAVRIDYITRSREQPSLLIVIQRKKDVRSTSFVWLVKATAGYPVYNTNGLPTRAPAQPLNQAAFPVASD
jgi:hypothetical protein